MYRIALINPPAPDDKVWVREGRCQQWDIWGAPFPPLSLALVSRQLIADGFQTLILDCGPERKDLAATLADCRQFAPDLIILATTSPTLHTDLHWFAGKLREARPGAAIAALGSHVSALPVETLERYAHLDFAVIGEPEITSLELARKMRAKAPDLSGVLGISFRGGSGKIAVNETRPPVADLDLLGLPDWSHTDFSKYRIPIRDRPFSLVCFSRGCAFQCRFCAARTYYGRGVRKRSVAKIIEEIRYNLSLGVRDLLFWTEMLTNDRAFLHRFLDELIAQKLHREIRWVCNSRVDTLDYELAAKMKKAGCWQIAFGFEFGSDETLARAKKGGQATIEQGRRAALLARKAGIEIDGHFILGFPGEKESDLRETIDFACSLPLTFAHFYAAVPFPGAPLYQEALQHGWIRDPSWESMNQDFSALDTPELRAAVVNKHISLAYRRFYRRPVIWLRMLRIPSGIREYLNLCRIGLTFMRGRAWTGDMSRDPGEQERLPHE